MNYTVKSAVGIGDRVLLPGDVVSGEKLGVTCARLVQLKAIEANGNQTEADPRKEKR